MPETTKSINGVAPISEHGKQSALPDGFKYSLPVAIQALRFLAENEKPAGGSYTYNSEHLHQIANDLEKGSAQISSQESKSIHFAVAESSSGVAASQRTIVMEGDEMKAATEEGQAASGLKIVQDYKIYDLRGHRSLVRNFGSVFKEFRYKYVLDHVVMARITNNVLEVFRREHPDYAASANAQIIFDSYVDPRFPNYVAVSFDRLETERERNKRLKAELADLKKKEKHLSEVSEIKKSLDALDKGLRDFELKMARQIELMMRPHKVRQREWEENEAKLDRDWQRLCQFFASFSFKHLLLKFKLFLRTP